MKKIIFFVGAFTAFIGSGIAQATASQNVGLVLSNAIITSFTTTNNNTGPGVSIPFSSVTSYNNGIASAAQQLMVQSNNAFNVTVAAISPNFTYTGSALPAPVMPVNSVLALAVAANSTGGTVATSFNDTYASLNSNAQNLISSANAGGSETFSIQYKATPGFAYPAGTYTTGVVYTATQP